MDHSSGFHLHLFFWNRRYPKFTGAIIKTFIGISFIVVTMKLIGVDLGLTAMGDLYPEVSARKITIFGAVFHLNRFAIKTFG